MPLFNVSTIDGKSVVVDSDQASADDLLDTARTRGHLGFDEVVSATGRDTQGHTNAIAIPYHAIVAIRRKR
jgi:hypothetical protein